MIRAIRNSDLLAIKRIHEKYYGEEFSLPNFRENFIGAFVVENDTTGEIISAGGVRTIAECVILTNKDLSVRERRSALLQILDVSAHITAPTHDQLHAFIQEKDWENHLKKYHFDQCKGTALYLQLR